MSKKHNTQHTGEDNAPTPSSPVDAAALDISQLSLEEQKVFLASVKRQISAYKQFDKKTQKIALKIISDAITAPSSLSTKANFENKDELQLVLSQAYDHRLNTEHRFRLQVEGKQIQAAISATADNLQEKYLAGAAKKAGNEIRKLHKKGTYSLAEALTEINDKDKFAKRIDIADEIIKRRWSHPFMAFALGILASFAYAKGAGFFEKPSPERKIITEVSQKLDRQKATEAQQTKTTEKRLDKIQETLTAMEKHNSGTSHKRKHKSVATDRYRKLTHENKLLREKVEELQKKNQTSPNDDNAAQFVPVEKTAYGLYDPISGKSMVELMQEGKTVLIPANGRVATICLRPMVAPISPVQQIEPAPI